VVVKKMDLTITLKNDFREIEAGIHEISSRTRVERANFYSGVGNAG